MSPPSLATRLCRLSLATLLCCRFLSCALAEPIPVRHIEGTVRGFLSARDNAGRIIAVGDLYQVVHGNRVTSHLVFHFKDGSLDEETTVYTQHGTFKLISDRHIQRGPFFPQPMDVAIDALTGQVTVRTTGKDGKPEVDTEHLDLPPDLSNGLTGVAAKNIPPQGPPFTVSMLLATPKARLIKLVLTPSGEDSFTVAGSPRNATRIEMKIDLGGVTGVVAPLIGKQPPDLYIWITGGDAPAVVREVGYLYRGGPTLTVELASPVWPQPADSRIVGAK
jgi:hypothetical protein